ncbi:hypothetical protein BDF21DRAFT_456396 [Thamnidium elegans]|nr:hypothetical protein BDF21DRAFT_456396 [Thamnidium elegans]
MEDPSDNSLYILPPKYTPGTDLMSKLILNNDIVINIVVSAIIGDNTSNKYSTKPTEWPNFKRSNPLEPLVALAHFLIEGKSALVNMEKEDDETIKKLYTIAKQIVSQEIEILLETSTTEATNKRAIDCLDGYIKALGNIHKKRFEETPTDNCETLSVESASTLDTPSPNVCTSATISIRGLKCKDQENFFWEFIDEYRTQHGSNMDWEKCFSEGKKKGLLQQYSTRQMLNSK